MRQRLAPEFSGGQRRLTQQQVEYDSTGNDGHEDIWTSGSDLKANASVAQFAHNSVGSCEAVRGAASQHDSVGAFDGILRCEQVGLASAGTATADIDSADSTAWSGDDGDSGIPLSSMADGDAVNGVETSRANVDARAQRSTAGLVSNVGGADCEDLRIHCRPRHLSPQFMAVSLS